MNHTGSVRKEGKKWYYVIELGKGTDGKRKQKKKRGFRTKKDAQVALTRALHEMNSGTYVEPSTQRIEDFFMQWLEIKKTSVAESSYSTYYYNLKGHIIPELGDMTLGNLKPLHVQQFYSKLINDKELNHNTVRKIHTMLVNALDLAVKLELVVKNVARLADPPKETKSEMEVWDVEEVIKFLNTAKESPYYIVYLLAINTGMTQGEILGLPWDNLDLEEMIIYVKQTLSNQGGLKATTKTSAGLRTVAIPEEIIPELKQYQLEQKKHRLKIGPAYIDNNLVCASVVGTPINPSNLRRNFNKLIEAAELKKIRFHDLRHTHATLLLKQGVHPKIVSERLGHADTRMTLDRYSHLLPNMQKDTARQFGKMLYGKVNKNEDDNNIILEVPDIRYVTKDKTVV